jgi:hypothetical protein
MLRVEGPFESVAWNHAAVALAVAVFPRHPRWGWLPLGTYGRHEFTSIAELARTDAGTAQALLRRALER